MQRRKVGAAILIAGLVALSLMITPPASAVSGVQAVVVGNGTIAPALPIDGSCTSGPSTHTFTNTVIRYQGVVNVGTGMDAVAGSVQGNASGSGSSLLCSNGGDSATQSAGSGIYTASGTDLLNPGGVNASCPYTYQRVGPVVAVTATCSFSGAISGTVVFRCGFAFEPSSSPIGTYLLQGTCAGV